METTLRQVNRHSGLSKAIRRPKRNRRNQCRSTRKSLSLRTVCLRKRRKPSTIKACWKSSLATTSAQKTCRVSVHWLINACPRRVLKLWIALETWLTRMYTQPWYNKTCKPETSSQPMTRKKSSQGTRHARTVQQIKIAKITILTCPIHSSSRLGSLLNHWCMMSLRCLTTSMRRQLRQSASPTWNESSKRSKLWQSTKERPR